MSEQKISEDEIEKEARDLIEKLAGKLSLLYKDSGEDLPECICRNAPNTQKIIEALKLLIDIMLPGRRTRVLIEAESFSVFLEHTLARVWNILRPEIIRAIPFRWKGRAALEEGLGCEEESLTESAKLLKAFFSRLPQIRETLIEDIKAAYVGDPAALTFAEVKLSYPGLLAIASHRLSHELYSLNIPVIPRIMSEWTHTETGVDIHPGATIGKGFFIDHATGVVIGETAQIGDNVKLYQGVTLGARSIPLDEHGRPIKHIKRHPTIGNNVIIYSNASILGAETLIGDGSVIGGNVFLVKSVPPGSTVVAQTPKPRIKSEE